MEPITIGKIWYISAKKCIELNTDFRHGVIVCQSTCGQYWTGGTDNSHHRGRWKIGEPIIQLAGETLLRVNEKFSSGTSWEIIRTLIHTNELGPPNEVMAPPTPPPTLKDIRTKRFALITKEQADEDQ